VNEARLAALQWRDNVQFFATFIGVTRWFFCQMFLCTIVD